MICPSGDRVRLGKERKNAFVLPFPSSVHPCLPSPYFPCLCYPCVAAAGRGGLVVRVQQHELEWMEKTSFGIEVAREAAEKVAFSAVSTSMVRSPFTPASASSWKGRPWSGITCLGESCNQLRDCNIFFINSYVFYLWLGVIMSSSTETMPRPRNLSATAGSLRLPSSRSSSQWLSGVLSQTSKSTSELNGPRRLYVDERETKLVQCRCGPGSRAETNFLVSPLTIRTPRSIPPRCPWSECLPRR